MLYAIELIPKVKAADRNIAALFFSSISAFQPAELKDGRHVVDGRLVIFA